MIPRQSGCDLQRRQGIGREASEEWDRCSNDDLNASKALVSPLTFRARFIVPIDLIVEALLDVILGIHRHLTQLPLCRAGRRLRMSGAPSLVNGQTELNTANLQSSYAIHRCCSVAVILSRDFQFSTKIAGILYQKTRVSAGSR